jgi:hypothetical protein
MANQLFLNRWIWSVSLLALMAGAMISPIQPVRSMRQPHRPFFLKRDIVEPTQQPCRTFSTSIGSSPERVMDLVEERENDDDLVRACSPPSTLLKSPPQSPLAGLVRGEASLGARVAPRPLRC